MNVESFNLDHRTVAAPFVRIADRKTLPGGDTLIKYDVRFKQPNREHLEMPAVHSIEHLMAELMRNHTDALIDFSPMGCQTGFYALTLGLEPGQFFPILEQTCRDILAAHEVPAANEVQCGWGAHHSLEAAQDAVKDFLAGSDGWAQIYRADVAEESDAVTSGADSVTHSFATGSEVAASSADSAANSSVAGSPANLVESESSVADPSKGMDQ